ncbi:MAG: preprotein translocase subunit SecG [Gammaproteobacteria bacterium]|nr:preprotein translocase subunit SecG [Gammaproteobacteria bacterium]
MESIIIFVHVIAAIAITGLVLIQQGKGADMGASFGSGASQTVFGSSGSGNVLTSSTTILAVIFFVTSLGLAVLARQQANLSVEDSGLIENLDEISTQVSLPTGDDFPVFEEIGLESDIPVLDAADSDIPEVVQDALESVGDIPLTGEETE